MEKVTDEKTTVFLMGGGIGIPPILQLAKSLNCDKKIIVGYRDASLFLKEDLEKYGEVIIATEDGRNACLSSRTSQMLMGRGSRVLRSLGYTPMNWPAFE